MKHIYFFGDGKADGSAADKNLLGGKGANLAEMTRLGIPVPPGFTLNSQGDLRQMSWEFTLPFLGHLLINFPGNVHPI